MQHYDALDPQIQYIQYMGAHGVMDVILHEIYRVLFHTSHQSITIPNTCNWHACSKIVHVSEYTRIRALYNTYIHASCHVCICLNADKPHLYCVDHAQVWI